MIAGRWAPHYRTRFFRQLTNADRVHEVGFIADWERPFYYSMADLYVSPSVLEGLGITPIEAFACETPAIVTAATSGQEEVGSAGLVVPPFDAQALADAIQYLLANREIRLQMGKQGAGICIGRIFLSTDGETDLAQLCEGAASLADLAAGKYVGVVL